MSSLEDIAIKVDSVSKEFKLPHEKRSSVKSLFVNLFRGRTTYERQQVLKNVSLEINTGDFYGIVGRNGSGKSTLLKLLAGVYAPTKGHIHVNGKLTPFIELGVGFNPELTGRDNVYLNGALLGFSSKEIDSMYDDIVAFAELKKFMDQKLKNYSSGMQVRLAFSIAIQAKSDILLLDEVLAVGDAAFQQKCFDYFEDLKRRRQTVVFVSHDMGAVRRFCNKAVYISDGKITEEGTPSDIADLYAEANIHVQDSSQDQIRGEPPGLPSGYKIHSTIAHQNADSVTLKTTYKSPGKEKMYIGISIVKDGASLAEITSSLEKPLISNGEVTYTLDTSILNPGSYQIGGISLFRLKNRELLAVNKNKNEFVIKGSDITKGGALKLKDSWTYEKH